MITHTRQKCFLFLAIKNKMNKEKNEEKKLYLYINHKQNYILKVNKKYDTYK